MIIKKKCHKKFLSLSNNSLFRPINITGPVLLINYTILAGYNSTQFLSMCD